MTFKHTPATPLPWSPKFKSNGGDEIYGWLAFQSSEKKATAAKIAEAIKFSGKDAAANATYTIHAANAYPKLIDELRWFAQGPGGMRASALLRELGESV